MYIYIYVYVYFLHFTQLVSVQTPACLHAPKSYCSRSMIGTVFTSPKRLLACPLKIFYAEK